MKKIYSNGLNDVLVLSASGTQEEIQNKLIADFTTLVKNGLYYIEDNQANRNKQRTDQYFTWIEIRG